MKKLLLLICVSLFLSACGAMTEKITGESRPDSEPKPGSNSGKPQAGETVLFKSGPVNYSEGKVEKIEGVKYEIRSKDNIAKPNVGDVYALPKEGAKSDVKAGDFVVAYNYEIYWEGGEVKNVTDDLVEVEKASGGKLNVAHDKIVKVSPAAIADIKQSVEAKAFEDLGKTKKPVLPANWKPKAGDKIAAQWAFGSWHPADIKHVNANDIDIEWKNGWKNGNVARDKIAPYPTDASPMPKANDYVIVRPTNDTAEWKFAVVMSISGQELEVKFSDGKTQKVKVGDFIAMS
jgi:hypothetical protein